MLKDIYDELVPLNLRITIIALAFVITIVGTYLFVDANVSRDYVLDEISTIDTTNTYKRGFVDLVGDIENGRPTGIPSIDEAGTITVQKIEITKGDGDFKNIPSNYKTNFKSYTYYNDISWDSTSPQSVFAYSQTLSDNSTLYTGSGVRKLFDKYSWCAIGTYWADKFGLDTCTGKTFRIHMNNGRSYDIVCFDTKSPHDSNSINSVDGNLCIGHSANGNVCLTEFDLVNFNGNYPITKGNNKMKGIDLSEKDRSNDHASYSNVLSTGSLNGIPEYQGEVTHIELIEDPKVMEIVSRAVKEIQSLRSSK